MPLIAFDERTKRGVLFAEAALGLIHKAKRTRSVEILVVFGIIGEMRPDRIQYLLRYLLAR
jgi:hypothetical protein